MEVEFKDNSEEVLEAFEKATANALTAIGMAAETYAKKITPVATGRLRNSISHDIDTDDSTAIIGSNVEYAAFV